MHHTLRNPFPIKVSKKIDVVEVLKEKWSHRTNAFSSKGMRYGCTIRGGVYCAICSSEDLRGGHDREMMPSPQVFAATAKTCGEGMIER
jgi:hypothetical protein